MTDEKRGRFPSQRGLFPLFAFLQRGRFPLFAFLVNVSAIVHQILLQTPILPTQIPPHVVSLGRRAWRHWPETCWGGFFWKDFWSVSQTSRGTARCQALFSQIDLQIELSNEFNHKPLIRLKFPHITRVFRPISGISGQQASIKSIASREWFNNVSS